MNPFTTYQLRFTSGRRSGHLIELRRSKLTHETNGWLRRVFIQKFPDLASAGTWAMCLRIFCSLLCGCSALGVFQANAATPPNPAANKAAVAAAAAAEAGWDPATNYPALPPDAALRTIEVPPG